jgi:hypothetical protein
MVYIEDTPGPSRYMPVGHLRARPRHPTDARNTELPERCRDCGARVLTTCPECALHALGGPGATAGAEALSALCELHGLEESVEALDRCVSRLA